MIWSNCMEYNMEGSDFFKLANKFKEKFEKELSKVRGECGGVWRKYGEYGAWCGDDCGVWRMWCFVVVNVVHGECGSPW